jgi:hypothetical protein
MVEKLANFSAQTYGVRAGAIVKTNYSISSITRNKIMKHHNLLILVLTLDCLEVE